MKYYRGFPQTEDKKGTEISPIAIEILELCGDRLLGYYGIPENREEALIYMSQRVLLRTPSYGNGQNRRNGFCPDTDEATFLESTTIVRPTTIVPSRTPLPRPRFGPKESSSG